MSGHSKWNTIKRKKEKFDAQKGKIFTKIGREIAVAVRNKGPDPNTNFYLRDCISKAKSLNVPNENIERIIKRVSGENSCENYESFFYEGYGPEGSAFIVEALTDNRNRTVSNLRRYFSRNGGNLGSSGCVSFLFKEQSLISIEKKNLTEEELIENIFDIPITDIKDDGGSFLLLGEKGDGENIRLKLREKNYNIVSCENLMLPISPVKTHDENLIKKIQNLIDVLEDDDDIQTVWHNYEFDD
ncbi:MAG: YebC/PmpR family DNA-binding transcriptional regulator [Candidatus Improbicoccus pseudotrichonymphae]|uniref:Probable transcriptional regulatory protein CfP315_0230 n=1 Tax=Candidatus Improbicoccus pseudotrichonymphae TaxID=3033792 RepID=A0AA48IA56_9FIRM|nr:MAG: YebC/PmpR family DNA-binding transcriptional regulator [Candidatus Improbicoccus pseudotrichonymphae]